MLSSAPRRVLRRTLRLPAPPSHASTPASRLLSTLALLEQRDGRLEKGSLSAVTAGQRLGGPVTAFLAGSQARPAAEEAAKVHGLQDVTLVENGAYDKGLPEAFAALVAANVAEGGYTHVVATHSAFGKNVMPRLAALLDAQQISDIAAIQSEDSASKFRFEPCLPFC